MELINACVTPRDEIKSYDYLKPLIRGLLDDGIIEEDELEDPELVQEIENIIEEDEELVQANEGGLFEDNYESFQEGGGPKKGLGDALKGFGDKVKDFKKKVKKAKNYVKKRYRHKKKKVFAMPVSERSQMRQEAYKNFVKFIGFIFYLFYLPLKPWIWIMQQTFKKFQDVYAGTIVPL